MRIGRLADSRTPRARRVDGAKPIRANGARAHAREPSSVRDFARNGRDHVVPPPRLRLPDEPRARIPRTVVARAPAPVGGDGQHQPQRLAERAGEVGDRGVDRDDAVEPIDERGRCREIGQAVEPMDASRIRMRVERCVLAIRQRRLQHDPVDAGEREERGKRIER